jgi:serine/threonine protein kinase
MKPNQDINVASPPSKSSGIDDTMTQAYSTGTASEVGFGPPMATGEVGTLGPYRLVKELGHGGMGAVYAAIDTRLDRQLAIKTMLPKFAADGVAKERFLREARATAKVSHDNVVTVYEADERQGVPYIAMQYLEGYSLEEYLKKKGPPSLPQILRIASEAAAGLAAAHKIGLVHRDIKPANLWLEAPQGRVKVLDFGLAKPVDTEAEVTKSGAIVGTPAYMSPEQALGQKVDHRTDLFSLGVLLYRLCANRLPFSGPTTMAVLMALGNDEPQPVREHNPEVPEALAALIHQLLAKNANARPQSADEVRNRIREIARGQTVPQAMPVASSTEQPSVVYAPIQVTALPTAANPFADIDVDDDDATEQATTPTTPAKPTRQQPGNRNPLLIGGALAAMFAVLVAAGVIIIIKNKDGSETKIEVPDDSTVTIKDKTGKTITKVEPKKPLVVMDVDRKAAEWVIAQGGVVWIDDKDIKAVADLPKGPITVTHVNLAGKPVTDAGLVHLKELKNLTGLNLPGTPVTDAGLVHLKELKSLTTLDLRETQLTDAGLVHLKELKNLTGLILQGTKVTDAGLVHLKELKNLTRLDLGITQMTDAGLVHLKELKNLMELYLHGTAVTDAGLVHLKVLKNLTKLWLGVTQVTDAGLVHLKELNNLTELRLGVTQVTDAGLEHLKEHKSLKYLNLQQTKVTPKGLDELHAAIPGCRIAHDGGEIEAKK